MRVLQVYVHGEGCHLRTCPVTTPVQSVACRLTQKHPPVMEEKVPAIPWALSLSFSLPEL